MSSPDHHYLYDGKMKQLPYLCSLNHVLIDGAHLENSIKKSRTFPFKSKNQGLYPHIIWYNTEIGEVGQTPSEHRCWEEFELGLSAIKETLRKVNEQMRYPSPECDLD